MLYEKIYNNVKPINAFNELDIKIRFVFFAIYTDTKFTPNEREENYKKILNDFEKQISLTGIKLYEIEIVFIPIQNNSTDIKEFMVKWN